MRFPPLVCCSIVHLALLVVAGASAGAQQVPVPAAVASVSPEVGTLAPEFSISAVTRYGALRDPVRLSDFRGKTVVLAFFYRARTKG